MSQPNLFYEFVSLAQEEFKKARYLMQLMSKSDFNHAEQLELLQKVRDLVKKLCNRSIITNDKIFQMSANPLLAIISAVLKKQTSDFSEVYEHFVHLDNVVMNLKKLPSVNFNVQPAAGLLGHTPEVPTADNTHIAILVPQGSSAPEQEVLLKSFHYNISVIELSPESLANCEQLDTVHLILLDLRDGALPALTDEITKQVRGQAGRQIPFIILSSVEDFATRLSAVRAGASSFYSTPISPVELIYAIDSAIKTHYTEITPYRVLVVDDDKVMLDFATAVLENNQFSVRGELDPEKVLPLLYDFDPEVLLLDVHMPGCSGIELAKVIRQIPLFYHMSIIFLSADARETVRQSSIHLGSDDYLIKGCEQEDLVNTVYSRGNRARIVKALTNNLYDQDKHLTSIIEKTTNVVISFDLYGTVTAWNQAAEKFFKRKANTCIGQPILSFFKSEPLNNFINSALETKCLGQDIQIVVKTADKRLKLFIIPWFSGGEMYFSLIA